MSTFQDLPPEGKAALRDEFYVDTTTRERRVEILTLMRGGADEARMGRPCPKCKHFPFFAPHDEPLIEGHVYSDAGHQEIGITGYCEFCFDEITVEPAEDENWKNEAIAADIQFMAESMGPDTTVRVLTDEEARALFDDGRDF
jgi:hypothetical protein